MTEQTGGLRSHTCGVADAAKLAETISEEHVLTSRAADALAVLLARCERAETALRETDGMLQQALLEIRPGTRQWQEMTSVGREDVLRDFVLVARRQRRKNSRVLAEAAQPAERKGSDDRKA